MEVQLQQPINFSQPNMSWQPQIEEIRCRGGVSMENQSFDARQRLASYDRMELADLAVNFLSGRYGRAGLAQ